MLLDRQVAVVTGASRGVGRAVVKRFCQEGAAVHGIYRTSRDDAAALQNELRASGHAVCMHQGSVTDRTFIHELMEEIWHSEGRIDVLVNNAAVVRDGFLAHMAQESWDVVFDTSFGGAYTCVTEVLPYMLRREGGSIVNVVSPSGLLGREAQVNYATAKGAVAGLTRLVARRYRSLGIRCNAISPGLVDTDLIGDLSDATRAALISRTDAKRMADPEEIADAVLFLAGDMSRYCSGTILRADGGFYT